MKVRLKLFAVLADYLPADARDNAIEIEVADDATPHDVIDSFNVPRTSAHLVMRNGVFIAQGERDQPGLRDGDDLAVWPPVAGG